MFSSSQVACGLALVGIGLGLAVLASGCEDGCVRNSDCAEGYVCGDGVCALDITGDASMDSAVDASEPERDARDNDPDANNGQPDANDDDAASEDDAGG